MKRMVKKQETVVDYGQCNILIYWWDKGGSSENDATTKCVSPWVSSFFFFLVSILEEDWLYSVDKKSCIVFWKIKKNFFFLLFLYAVNQNWFSFLFFSFYSVLCFFFFQKQTFFFRRWEMCIHVFVCVCLCLCLCIFACVILQKKVEKMKGKRNGFKKFFFVCLFICLLI